MIPEEYRFTYEDFCRLPADGKIHEIIDGELFNHAAPNLNHQRASRKILYPIETFLLSSPIGEIFHAPSDVILSNENVVEPDLVYVSNEKRHILTRGNIQGAPDLIIEVLPPTDPDYDKKTKMQLYWRFKVPHFWIVEPDKGEIEIYRWGEDGYQLAGNYKKGDRFQHELFPGMVFDTTQIFAYV